MSGENVAGARLLRRRMTPAETVLWRLLRDRRLEGWKFRRQHPIGAYVLDFYCPVARLAIELDGSVHELPGVAESDANRQVDIESAGIRFLRLANNLVLHHQSDALDAIVHALQSPSPSAEGEGSG